MRYEVKVKWEVSTEKGSTVIDLEDLGCEVLEEWQMLSEQEKEKRIQEALNRMPDQPFMVLGNYHVQQKR